jgi:hypothetical protein
LALLNFTQRAGVLDWVGLAWFGWLSMAFAMAKQKDRHFFLCVCDILVGFQQLGIFDPYSFYT